jgi:hypothetical protein
MSDDKVDFTEHTFSKFEHSLYRYKIFINLFDCIVRTQNSTRLSPLSPDLTLFTTKESVTRKYLTPLHIDSRLLPLCAGLFQGVQLIGILHLFTTGQKRFQFPKRCFLLYFVCVCVCVSSV